MRAVSGGNTGQRGRNVSEAGVVTTRPRKFNRASPPTTVELRGVKVHFPFTPYACQKDYMGKVMDALFRSEHALLESPTGTGKTLCLLCATLAWQREQARLLGDVPANLKQPAAAEGTQPTFRRVPTIIYASRTHSQLTQVVQELKNTRYRPHHAVLGSREQMCVNPKVKKAHSTSSDINHDCSKLGKERKCRYRNKLETFRPPEEETSDGVNRGTQPIMDMEDLVEMGKKHKVCPFYYTRSQVERAELVLVPYNYLFDKDARSTTLAEIPWENSVVIFDEAHNLESFASDSASFDLSNHDIAGCITEVSRAINYVEAMPEISYNLKTDNLVKLKAIFLKIEDYLLNLGPQTAYSGEFLLMFFKNAAGVCHANHEILIEELRKVNDLIMDMRGTGATRGSPKIEHFVQCLKRVFGYSVESQCLAKAASYRAYVSPKANEEAGRTISYWCFAPALAMEELAALNVRSILVTSGTLSPLPSYAMELGIPFPHTLENPHIIRENQIHVRVIGKGVSGKELTSTYKRREDGEYYSELGNTLVSLAKVVPAGMLIFFPSYGVMNTCLERWGGPANSSSTYGKANNKKNFFAVRKKQAATKQYAFPQTPQFFANKNGPVTPWKRLLAAKAIVVEPRSSADLPDAMSEFKRLLDLPRSPGCILMGVCRGKISEGIDFANEMSRAVVITGLPFAPAMDAKVKLKREFLDGARAAGKVRASNDGGFGDSTLSKVNKLSGNEWYTQQAHRAVNQAIGRVIRNRTDYGSVLLLDSRFGQPRNQQGLSKWLRPHIQKDEGFGIAVRSLVQFYKKADTAEKERVETAKLEAAKAVPLQYEDEEEEEDSMTKIAIVKSVKGPTQSEEKGSDGAYISPGQVVARMDVKDMSRPGRSTSLERPTKSQPVSSELAGNSRDAVFASTRRDVTSSFKARTSLGSKEVAVRFMAKIKEQLPTSDQSTIKKAIVSMKTAGNKEDVPAYLSHAKIALSLICPPSKKFESEAKDKDNCMLFLFFRLLPKQHRKQVERMGMKVVFERSSLAGMCKECLTDLDFGRLRTDMLSLMHSLWCTETECMTNAVYIGKAQLLLRIMHKNQKGSPRRFLQGFMELVPGRYRNATVALNEEITASAKVSMLKEADSLRRGEDSIDSRRFVSSLAGISKENHQQSEQTNPELPSTSLHSQAGRKRPAVAPEKQPKKTINPYARKAVPSATGATVNVSAASSVAKPKSLASFLKSVASEPYVKPSAVDRRRAIKSNAPESLVCPICSNSCTEPFIAECGHLACLSCWLGWLKRSETCPTCRKGATKRSLAQAVFENSPGSTIPTPSQICSTKNDSDDELEIE